MIVSPKSPPSPNNEKKITPACEPGKKERKTVKKDEKKSPLERLMAEHCVTMESQYNGNEKPAAWDGAHHAWGVTFTCDGASEHFDYFTGSAHTSEPVAADVLAMLLLDARGPEYQAFEEWAEELGYDPDSRSAERVYEACKAIGKQLGELLGERFEAFNEAEHE